MEIVTEQLTISTQGNSEVVDITDRVAKFVSSKKIREGQVTVFVAGSTASVTTTEFEPGLRQDLPALFERLAPEKSRYHHDETWHDGNGHSHVRATLLGPSIIVPFSKGKLLLGTWQQIVLIDFDNRPRERSVVLQLIGS